MARCTVWDIWWDFRNENNQEWIVVQTNHPDYQHVDYITRYSVEDCTDENGHIDDWIENTFHVFRENIIQGRSSLHTIMKEFGHAKSK